MKNRYPGIHSFTADDSPIFYGRSREIKELFRLMVLNNVVVLFGKSGTGKTSLLQAGVAPLLNERLLQPVKLRLNNTHQSIARQLFEQFDEGEYLPMNTPDTLTLWEYCKLFDYTQNGETFTPLLVLDQFEELFTLYADKPEAQQQFVAELSDVVNAKTPEHIKTKVLATNPNISEAALQLRLSPPKVHIVISIRSDFLYLLDRLSEYIPAILRCRYEIAALNEENARLAIVQPAQMQGDFVSPTFQYAEEAIQNILATLTTTSTQDSSEKLVAAPVNKEIEAFQLQLLCSRIENKLLAEIKENKISLQNITIGSAFYGGKKGIANMLSDFYASVLDKIATERRLQVQKLVEEKLISNERRIIQERDFIKKEYHLTNDDLLLLCKERLLREEPRGGTFYYEISHDTLVAPILASYQKRAAEEEKARIAQEKAEAERKQKIAEAELAKEQAQKAELQKALDTAKQRTRFAVALLLLALGIAAVAVYFYRDAAEKTEIAEKQTALANEQKRAALKNIIQFYETRKEKHLKKAESYHALGADFYGDEQQEKDEAKRIQDTIERYRKE